ncbi:helix-turn-helix transcriptional regulator [Streptomyces sp. NBC_01235]|uniref:helix-turn-helix transcriptional regulator n=1 Tax=Streptomyces sp. NBC_01235 TaxID=2903788 RepID=UPI002E0E5C27|nr:helix-turn-helix transcriptional regulator [Streptomyces sp. NBC_01235]
MGNLGELSPYEARDAVGFVASMQRLKERAGLTYRELEERAARNGDVLARSTLADILRRTSLPRPDVLAAFVRACGDGQRVDAWLDARERIAAGLAAGAEPSTVSGPGQEAEDGPAPRTEDSPAARPRRATGRTVVLTAGLVVPLLALAVWGLFPGGSDGSKGSRNSADSSGAPAVPGSAAAVSGAASRAPVDGWVTVRPVRTPDLCLTDGRDRGGAYGSAVAVQLPCARATVPRTYLEPFGEGLYRIQWHHPQLGKGCLTIMSTGPVKGMLEPRNDCGQATLFRVEAASADDAGGFRLRPAHGSTCIGMAGDDSTVGAEAVEERCTGAADQRFLIRAD